MDTKTKTNQTLTSQAKLELWLTKALLTFILFLILTIGFISLTWGQTTIYTTNFGTTSDFPAGWSTNGTVAWIGSTNGSTGYSGASGSGSFLHANTTGTGYLVFNNNLSTAGYTNITVLWGALRNGGVSNMATLEYSINNGSTWNTVNFTDVSNNSTWTWVNNGARITLPESAEGVANLILRWTHYCQRGTNYNYIYRLDDFSVQGTPIPTCPTITAEVESKTDITCFSNSDGKITVSATGGAAPYTFSSNDGSTYVTGNNNPAPGQHTFEGLAANVVYKIRVKDASGCESSPIQ